MARGRTTALTIPLTPEEQRTLRAWQRSTTMRAGLCRRAQIILLVTEGRSITAIATTVGISRRFVHKGCHMIRDRKKGGKNVETSFPPL